MSRPRRDFDDFDDTLFDRDVARERREAAAEARRLGAEREKLFAEHDARMRAKARASVAEATRATILREYEHHGLAPPTGTLVSLPLLLQVGWRIETMGDGAKALVRPPAPEAWDGPRDRDSLPREAKRK